VRRKSSSVLGAVGVAAALVFALTGCGSEEEGKNSDAAGKPRKSGSSASASPEKDTKSSSPSPSASESTAERRSASPKQTRRASTPSARPSNTASNSGSTGGGTASGGNGGGRAPSGVQGTWYYPFLIQGKSITMTISGTSFTVTGNGRSCSGTINSSMRISSSCGGEAATGRAVLSEGGQKLTFNWTNDPPDRFGRARPQR
jgi:hypothetical protein